MQAFHIILHFPCCVNQSFIKVAVEIHDECLVSDALHWFSIDNFRGLLDADCRDFVDPKFDTLAKLLIEICVVLLITRRILLCWSVSQGNHLSAGVFKAQTFVQRKLLLHNFICSRFAFFKILLGVVKFIAHLRNLDGAFANADHLFLDGLGQSIDFLCLGGLQFLKPAMVASSATVVSASF